MSFDMTGPLEDSKDFPLITTPPLLPTKNSASLAPIKHITQDDGDYEDDDDYEDDEESDSNGFSLESVLDAPTEELLTIRELHARIHDGGVDLNPPYQRDVVWPAVKQSLLIKSLVQNFPVPPVLFGVVPDEEGVPTRVCIDGKQRLTSIQRFVDGQLPYINKKKKIFFTSPESAKHRLQLPEADKEKFLKKQIRCVEYSDLTPAMEREIFKRVQQGMQLTTAEKLAAIDSPWAEWISGLESRHVSVEGGLSQALVWDTKRGREFQNVAQFVYCCDGYPNSRNVPTAPKMAAWLSRVDIPGDQFKEDIEQALVDFGRIAADEDMKMAFTIPKRVAPIEFVFIGVLLYVIRRATDQEKAQSIQHMRAQIRSQFTHIAMNTNVGGAIWHIIEQLKNKYAPSKRKRKDSEDSDYHPEPISTFGNNRTRSKRR